MQEWCRVFGRRVHQILPNKICQKISVKNSALVIPIEHSLNIVYPSIPPRRFSQAKTNVFVIVQKMHK